MSNSDSTREPFAMIPKSVLLGCSAQACRLYGLLALSADRRTGRCHPSRRFLAKKMGFAKTATVDRYIRELESHGHIMKERRAYTSNLYTLRFEASRTDLSNPKTDRLIKNPSSDSDEVPVRGLPLPEGPGGSRSGAAQVPQEGQGSPLSRLENKNQQREPEKKNQESRTPPTPPQAGGMENFPADKTIPEEPQPRVPEGEHGQDIATSESDDPLESLPPDEDDEKSPEDLMHEFLDRASWWEDEDSHGLVAQPVPSKGRSNQERSSLGVAPEHTLSNEGPPLESRDDLWGVVSLFPEDSREVDHIAEVLAFATERARLDELDQRGRRRVLRSARKIAEFEDGTVLNTAYALEGWPYTLAPSPGSIPRLWYRLVRAEEGWTPPAAFL